ncbi:MAG TPA: aminotransferase class IV [Mycobacteriales bacterium]|nr:aminotransferase class IV [Mycobacteriales bacterium]
MSSQLTGVLHRGLVDPDTPLLRADDPGVVRGDGVFESIRWHDGRLDALDAHLSRLAASAAALELPPPDLPAWRTLVAQLSEAWTGGEAAVRLFITRRPSEFAIMAPIEPSVVRQRREGAKVITLSRGMPANAHEAAPWLLGGAKTTSYAINMAAIRYARAHGADDAVFVTTDGLILEAPTATVVWAVGGTLCTPPTELGILRSTTLGTLFDAAPAHGFSTKVMTSTVEDLHAADGVWLVSSMRCAVAVTSIDGVSRSDGGLTARVQAAAGLQTSGE